MIVSAMVLAATATCKVPFRDPIMRRAETIHYPALAPRERVGAVTVIVRLTLGPDGHVEDAAILQSSGYSAIDREAWRAARASDYLPAIRDCTPTEGTFTFRANFDPKNPNPTPEPMYTPEPNPTPEPSLAQQRLRSQPIAQRACAIANRPAGMLHFAGAQFPESVRKIHGSLTTVVTIVVSPSGSVKDVIIARSSGNPDFDTIVLHDAFASTYKPKIVNCRPVVGTTTVSKGWENP